MIGISIEAGMTCPSCEKFIPLNALVSTFRCAACGDVHPMDTDAWKSLLEDALEEAPLFAESEGRSSTIFGTYNWKITYGRLTPRYDGTREDIPHGDALAGLPSGRVLHPGTGASTSVRAVPDFCADFLTGVVAIIGEEPSLLPGESGASDQMIPALGMPEAAGVSGPVAFQCPGCGASLIVDESVRKATCSYCGIEAAMPDDLWQRLHPAKKTMRWFLLFDPISRPFAWEDQVLGASADRDGDLFLAVENPQGDMPLVARLRPDWTPVWVRSDLESAPRCDADGPGIMTGPTGDLLLPAGNGRDLITLSRDDGSLLAAGTDAAAVDPPGGFTLHGCRSMAILPDGSMFLLVDRPADDGSEDCREFLRFDPEGIPLPLWPPVATGDKPRQTGFLARIRKFFSSEGSRSSSPLMLEGIESRPTRTRETDLQVFSGSDGTLFLFSDLWLAAFNPEGTLRYRRQLTGGSLVGRPAALKDGRVLVLGEDEECRIRVMELSADGASFAPLPLPGGDADSLEDAEILVPAHGGRLYILGSNGFRKLLQMDGAGT